MEDKAFTRPYSIFPPSRLSQRPAYLSSAMANNLCEQRQHFVKCSDNPWLGRYDHPWEAHCAIVAGVGI